MDEEAFNKLLSVLDPDRERAAEKYEKLRQKLITFFRSRNAYSPEDCADKTFDRVAKKISEGVELYTSNPFSYFLGVARNILLECWQEQIKLSSRLNDLPLADQLSYIQPVSPLGEEESEKLLQYLDQCLKSLPKKSCLLIVQYYQGETSTKIKNRKKLARELGISINTLRIKALRIRQKLKDCVTSCLERLTAK